MKAWTFLTSTLGLVWWLTLFLLASTWNWRGVFIGGQAYFVDPDCYSRMTRVQQVIAAPWRPVRFHDFENAPVGTIPHTTAPMDLLVAALAAVFEATFRVLAFRHAPSCVDLAGAYVSPVLGAVMVGFLWWWGRNLALPNRTAMLALAAISPILAHGFQLGRPDHQSLIVLLVAAALATEIALWKRHTLGWEMLSALLWALALWTSLFEPMILLAATLLMRFAVLGKKAIPDRRTILFFVFLLGCIFLFEGWRVRTPSLEEGRYLFSWAVNIGELRHATLSQLFCWTGWFLILSPALLFWRSWTERDSSYGALALFLLLLMGLSLWHMRWGYFLAIAFALTLPWALASIPWKPVTWIAFAISLWPVAEEWDRQLWPDQEQRTAREEDREEAYLLREAAHALISPERTIILAPWWVSSAIAYWSGQRCVGGSSHESLAGIVESSRFYLATDPEEAKEILRRRAVNYVIAYEPSRVVSNAAQILQRPPPKNPLGETLYNHPDAAPSFLDLVYRNRFFKVFEFVDRR